MSVFGYLCLQMIFSCFLKLGSLRLVDLECDWYVQRLSCPPFGTTDWDCLKEKQNCQGGKEYHCLKDEDGNWIQTCAESKTCSKGQEPIFSNTDGIKCQPCNDPGRYEPAERILSSTYSECRRIKKICHKDVSFECYNITTKYTQDRQCQCDYTKDYIPQSYDFDSESWICTEADKLNCVPEPCPEDAAGMKEQRGPDYRCTPDTVSTTSVLPRLSTSSSSTAAILEDVTKEDYRVKRSRRSVPGKPESLAVIDRSTSSFTVTWNPPVDDGGAPIHSYLIEYWDTSLLQFDGWQECGRVTGNVTTWTKSGLVKGHVYDVRVSAENEIGNSEPSDELSVKLRYLEESRNEVLEESNRENANANNSAAEGQIT